MQLHEKEDLWASVAGKSHMNRAKITNENSLSKKIYHSRLHVNVQFVDVVRILEASLTKFYV